MERYQYRDSVCNELQHLYDNVGHFTMSWRDFLKRKQAIYARADVLYKSKKLRSYHLEYIRGYDRALFNDLQQNKLEFGYYLNGIFYSVWNQKTTSFKHTTCDLVPSELHTAYTKRHAVSMMVLKSNRHVWDCESCQMLEKTILEG